MSNQIFRIVPNIYSDDIDASKKFYIDFLRMKLVMDMNWVLTFASEQIPSAQVTILRNDKKQSPDNKQIFLSIEVSDVDEFYQRAKIEKIEIVYEITNENWDVRRFFVKDPNGVTINILMHTH